MSPDEIDTSPAAAPDTARAPEHWILLAAAVTALVGLIVLGAFITPDERGYGTHERLGLPPCGMLAVTGVPCPGCGVTTSVALAASGRFGDSFVNQPFGLLFALASAVFAVVALWMHFRGRDLYAEVRRIRLGRWGIVVGAALVVSWIYKIVQVL